MEILFITGNKEKVAIANTILNKLDITVKAMKIDCPEIQVTIMKKLLVNLQSMLVILQNQML